MTLFIMRYAGNFFIFWLGLRAPGIIKINYHSFEENSSNRPIIFEEVSLLIFITIINGNLKIYN